MSPKFKSELDLIEQHLRLMLQSHSREPIADLNRFYESLTYSVFSEGKRFRPLLALLTAKALGRPETSVLPLATAVELIHTYSLIHDDLPCMDNDDTRRGLPTNHKVFGEAGALLAGDALLTQAFFILAQSASPRAAQAVQMVALAAGPRGMVAGQALDIEAQKPNLETLQAIHERKTGALIRVSVEAAAVLCGASVAQIESLRKYGEHLGMAFQLADDVQDFNPSEPEKVSYASLLGVPETLKRLQETSDLALAQLSDFSEAADGLREMVHLNLKRA